jgi:hypothetical protein
VRDETVKPAKNGREVVLALFDLLQELLVLSVHAVQEHEQQGFYSDERDEGAHAPSLPRFGRRAKTR